MEIIKTDYVVSGIQTHVYSLSTKQPDVAVAVLFFLHGRHGSCADVEIIVHQFLNKWGSGEKGNLYIVTFDHRNHGGRVVDVKSNNTWTESPVNASHGMDMYSIQMGTAQDVSLLIDFLPAYLFPHGESTVKTWGVAGISLGGHSTWIALSSDPRIHVGIPIIGCPDYEALMMYRTTKSNIPYGAPHIPPALAALITRKDPAAKNYKTIDESNPFLGKKILVLSGEEDTLVPWIASKNFVDGLHVGKEGNLKVFVEKGVGHKCTEEMIKLAGEFLVEHM